MCGLVVACPGRSVWCLVVATSRAPPSATAHRATALRCRFARVPARLREKLRGSCRPRCTPARSANGPAAVGAHTQVGARWARPGAGARAGQEGRHPWRGAPSRARPRARPAGPAHLPESPWGPGCHGAGRGRTARRLRDLRSRSREVRRRPRRCEV